MILDRITLNNFRCFASLDFPLDRHLNVFVGGNGSGKSSILHAIAIGLAPILWELPFSKRPKGPSIELRDIHLVKDDQSSDAATIMVRAEFYEGELATWTQTRSRRPKSNRSAAKTQLGYIKQYVGRLTDQHNAGLPYQMPIFAFYGTSRGVDAPSSIIREQSVPKFFRRLISLEGALDTSASFRRSIGWFDLMESRELRQIRDNEDKGNPSEINWVRHAISGMVEGIDNPRIDGETGHFVVDYLGADGHKVKLSIDQLSDGYQVLLGVVMDFALRLALANPPENSRANPLEAEAILIIDEVDLHLHPAWQQEVVPRLRRTFPHTQIILTTHSPQVLSTVDAKYIRRITRVGETTTTTPPPYQTRGVASASVMAEVQHVDPVPKVKEAEDLHQYRAMIAEGTHDSDVGREIRARLEAHFEPTHPLMLDLDRTSRFYEFKRRFAHEKV